MKTAGRIEDIGEAIKSAIEERGIIARCELLNRVYKAVRQNPLGQEEIGKLHALVGGRRPAPVIFASIINGKPVFNGIPAIDSFTIIEGRIFHFRASAGYGKKDFQKAYRRFRSRRDELLTMVEENLTYILEWFMSDAGYCTCVHGPSISFRAKDGKEVLARVYSDIRAVMIEDFEPFSGERVAVVPHAERMDPFVDFFRGKGPSFEEAGIEVWVVNMEEGSIDPFIGSTSDMDIYSQFKNPKLSSIIRSTWISK